MKIAFFVCASIGLSLSACQSDTEMSDNEVSGTKMSGTKTETKVKTIPPLPEAGEFDGFIVYFKDAVIPSDVLTELTAKLNVNEHIQSTLATGGVLVQLVFTDEEAQTVREKTQAFWQALHQHESIIVAEPNLMMTIGNNAQ